MFEQSYAIKNSRDDGYDIVRRNILMFLTSTSLDYVKDLHVVFENMKNQIVPWCLIFYFFLRCSFLAG